MQQNCCPYKSCEICILRHSYLENMGGEGGNLAAVFCREKGEIIITHNAPLQQAW